MIKAASILFMTGVAATAGYIAASRMSVDQTAAMYDRAKESVGGRLPFVVLAVSGVVQYQPMGSSEWRTVKKGEVLLAGAKIQVKDGTMSMRTGRSVNLTLGKNTRVSIHTAHRRSDGNLEAKFRLEQGEIVASVSKHFVGGGFTIETASGTYTGSSTVFAVASSSGGDLLMVKDGTVFSAAGGVSRQFTERDGAVARSSDGFLTVGVAASGDLEKLIVGHAQVISQSASMPEMDRPFVAEEERERLRALVVRSAQSLKAGDFVATLGILTPTVQVNGQTITAVQAAEFMRDFLNVHTAQGSEIGAAGVGVTIDAVSMPEATAIATTGSTATGTGDATAAPAGTGATETVASTAAPATSPTAEATTTAPGTTTGETLTSGTSPGMTSSASPGVVVASATTILTGSLVATESVLQDRLEVLTCEIFEKPVIRMKWVYVDGAWKMTSVIITY